jgi:hypothetical protein
LTPIKDVLEWHEYQSLDNLLGCLEIYMNFFINYIIARDLNICN